MNDKLRAGMPAVMQLTRAGRLQEATAAIQRMLGGHALAPAVSEPRGRTERAPIEGVFRVINEGPSRANERCYGKPASRRPQPVPEPSPDGVVRGQFITGSYTNQAGTRAYKLYIPSGYCGRPLPLVVMLHGCTQGPDDFAAGTRMNQIAEEQPCLVLYPAQAQGANASKCWNWFKESDQRRDQGEPSILAGITRHIMSAYHADSRRIYVAGLSAGGAMAVIMGTTYPELYAAIGVHSGLPFAAAHDLPSAFTAMRQGNDADACMRDSGVRTPKVGQQVVPTIVFHGDHDSTVHPCNGDQVVAQSGAISARGRVNPQAQARPQVVVQRGQVVNGHAYTRTIYREANERAIVEHWLVHGAGHAWSGGSVGGSFTDPNGPDASQEMIRFFLEHPQLTRH